MTRTGVRDRGSLAVELAILMPGFIALIVLAVIVGRSVIAQGAVELAAHDAARAASLARTAGTAGADAESAARTTLANQGLGCVDLSVEVNTSEFARPVGQPAAVYVTITCTVSFADIAPPGAPRSRTMSASFTSPLDVYRSRS
jgi:Flp pilus assembly protein TadG